MEVKKEDLKSLLILILYKIFLELIYVKIIVPTYGYSGFQNNFSFMHYSFYWLIFLFFSIPIISLYRIQKPSAMILLIIYMVGFIPGIVLQGFMPQSNQFIILFLIYWSLILLFYRLVPNIKFNINIEDNLFVYLITVFFIFIIFFISLKYTGLRLNFNLLNVYELREDALMFNMPILLSYSFSAAKVCLPILFVVFIEKKQLFFSAIILITQFLAFSIDGSKATLFSIVFTFIVYKFIKEISVKNISYLISLSVILAFLEPVIMKTDIIILFIIRRLFFVPNLLHFYYYDFFSQNKIDFFAQGALGKLGLKSNYDTAIPKIIGQNYYNSSDMIANNGLFSDAYYNLGWLGILLLPLLLIVVFKLLDACARGIKSNILIASIITTSYTFISSSFFTVLLTHGFLLICFVLFIIPKERE